MTLKELYELLAKVERGSEMEALIKAEITAVRNEAAKSRVELTNTKKTFNELIAALELQDGEDALTVLTSMKSDLEAVKKTGKKPSELANQVEKLTKDLAGMQANMEAEKAKNILASKTNAALAALQKHNAANPEQMTKLILDNFEIAEDGGLKFKLGDKVYDNTDEGVGEWAKENAWAIKNPAAPGAGGGGGNGGGKQPTSLHEAVKMSMGQ